jgi:lysophospholipase L1-like esterase
MTFTPKNWQDAPSTATPITAAALEDIETRLAGYTDEQLAALGSGGSGSGVIAPFAATTDYVAGQPVTYSGQTYTAKVDFTSGASFSSADWDVLPIGTGTRVDLPAYLASANLSHGYDAATQTYNITPANFANFRLALSKAKAGVAPCKVTFDGDSITGGFGLTTREVNAWPEQCRALMATSGRWGTIYEGGPLAGYGGASATSGENDSRLTWDGNTSTGGGAFAIASSGGIGNTSASATGGVLTFGPVTCDVFDIYDRLAGLPGGSGWYWKVDGGSETFVSQAGAGTGQGMRKTTVSAGSYGSHTLTIRFPNSAYGVIGGIGVRKNADTGGTYMMRRGIGGSAIGDGTAGASLWASPVGFEGAYVAQTSHLAIVSLGTNPEPSGYVPADWKANMIAFLTAIKATGADVLLALSPPGGDGVNASQVAYLAAIAPLAYQVADQLDVGLFDWFARWGCVNTAPIDAYYQPSGSQGHPVQAGANDVAFGVFNALCRIA